MYKYKIVASDLDGTLLDSNSELSEENKKSISELNKKGVIFVPSTGRTYNDIPKCVFDHPDIRYIIYSNGAGIYDKETDSHVLMAISNYQTNEIADVICSYDTHITLRHKGVSYVDEKLNNKECFEYYHVSKPHSNVLENFAEAKKDFNAFLRTLDNIEMFCVFFHTKDDFEECKERLLKIEDIYFVEAFEYNFEIFYVDAGKGKALKKLAEMLNVDIKATIGVGDSDNDISMIKEAGLGLAMKKSSEALKKEATQIICDNDSHCVEYILNNFINEKILKEYL